MTDNSLPLAELVAKAGDDDFLRASWPRLPMRLRQANRVLVTYCHGGDTKVMHEILDRVSTQRLDALIMVGEASLYERTGLYAAKATFLNKRHKIHDL